MVRMVWSDTRAQGCGIKLPGAKFKTSERKYFAQTAHSEAVELVLQDAGDTRGVDRFRKGCEGPLNVGLCIGSA